MSLHTGSAALRVAAVYRNQADYASARPWYEKGYEIQSTVDSDSLENAIAMGKVARCYAQNNDFEKSKELFARAFAIQQKEYEETRKFLEECIEQMIYYHGESRIDVLLFRESLGDCEMKENQFAKARAIYAKVLNDRERFFPADLKSLQRLEEKYEKAKDEVQAN